MNLYFDIPLNPASGVFHAVIEIPRGSNVKYEFNETYNTIFVDRIFRTPVNYPQNYGFFPRTWNKYDSDPSDVIVISTESFQPGTVVPVRVVGIIYMEDTGELDHKILAVPTGLSNYSHCHDLNELPKEIVENLKWFLKNYKYRDTGTVLKILGSDERKKALEFLEECNKEFLERREARKTLRRRTSDITEAGWEQRRKRFKKQDDPDEKDHPQYPKTD